MPELQRATDARQPTSASHAPTYTVGCACIVADTSSSVIFVIFPLCGVVSPKVRVATTLSQGKEIGADATSTVKPHRVALDRLVKVSVLSLCY